VHIPAARTRCGFSLAANLAYGCKSLLATVSFYDTKRGIVCTDSTAGAICKPERL